MASGKSTYLAQKLEDHVFGLATYTFPTTAYLSLHTQAGNVGGTATEFSGHNYARKSVALDAAQWSRSGTTISNDNQLDFPVLSGGSQVSMSFGIWDAPTGGNLLYWGDFAAGFQKTYAQYDQPSFPAGALQIVEA